MEEYAMHPPGTPLTDSLVPKALISEVQSLANMGFFEWRIVENTVSWSDGLFEIFGLDRTSFTPSAQDFIARVHPDDQSAIQRQLEDACRKGGTYQHEERIIRSDGDIRTLESRGRVFKNAEGQPTVMIGACIDITDRVRSQAALQAAEQRSQLIVDHTKIVVWEADLEQHQFSYVSGYCEEFLGLPYQNWREPGFWRTRIHVDDVDRVQLHRKLVSDSTADHRIEYRVHKQDQSIVWIEEVSRCVETSGEFKYQHGVMLDVTERKMLEQQYIQSQKMEAVGLLAGGVAHDFNNLLMVIMTHADFLQLEETSQAEKIDSASAIQLAAKRAAALTQQLLFFARKSVFTPTDLDVHELISGPESLLSRLIRPTIEMQFFPAARDSLVKADRNGLEQALMNLIVNASASMPEGGIIHVKTQNLTLPNPENIHWPKSVCGDFIELLVVDQGEGISVSDQPRVFEPFFTTKPVGQGTGLGLSVAYGIITQYGGHISLRSTSLKGTTFQILLPVSTASLTQIDSTGRDLSAGMETVLVVDDEPTVRDSTTKVLKHLGYKVLVASGAKEAIEIAINPECSIQLLLTDIAMPEISGLQLANTLTLRLPNLRVLYMTGYENTLHWDTSQVAPVLNKPFSVSQLAEAVRKQLNTRNAENRNAENECRELECREIVATQKNSHRPCRDLP